jgi:predicted ATP-grasp superfamily ATP-dependent carboligase
VLDPEELIELVEPPDDLVDPVLVHALDGFVDAGAAVRLARAHLLATSPDRTVLARFDVDQLFDYRARRPPMVFVRDHWESYAAPSLELHVLRDDAGVPYLLLAGPEPDVQWERFSAAVEGLVRALRVRLTVGLEAIPMGVPHTRPAGVTAHASSPDLVTGYDPWVATVQVPGAATNLLELRLGEAGHDAMGFAAHVPHYLSQVDYPAAAVSLLEAVSRASGLRLPTTTLVEAATRTRAEVDAQIAESEEVQAVVQALESQYDAYVGGRDRGDLLADDSIQLPSADELGAELERFLAEQARRKDDRDG